MKTVGYYLREHIRHICLYTGFIGVFVVVFYLYNLPMSAVSYAFFLSVVWIALYGAAGFARYYRKHRALEELEQRTLSGLNGLPEISSLIEEDYQRILHKLYEEKLETESAARIGKQELLDFYGMWAHQIKTPIAAMRVMLQSYEEEQGEQETALYRDMKLELFKIEQYVELVLTYLRLGDISKDLAFAECPLDPVIRQAVRKYSKMFILKKIGLNYTETGKTVLTDEKWLSFVLEQILSNALKYTKKGSISIYFDAQELVIEDTGIGISPEDLPRVFEKGFTGYNGRRDKKSTGIGLYLCKSVMDKLGNQIRIESEVGRGTRVCLSLERPEITVE